MFEQCWQDARIGWRGLRRAPGFAALAIVTLAVGIGGAAVMFALVYGVLLRPLPVPDQERVLVAWKSAPASPATRLPFHADDLRALADATRVFTAVAGVGYQSPVRVVAVEGGVAGYVQATAVTGQFFDALGVAPRLGRGLTESDDVAGAPPAAVITHGFWQRRYGGARAAIGRRLVINEQAFTVVGIMPPDLDYPRGVEVWVPVTPFSASIAHPTFREAAATELQLLARISPGLRTSHALDELRALMSRLDGAGEQGAAHELVPVIQSYEEAVAGDARGSLLVLAGAVGLVLLISSANVANLLLLRGEQRRSEIAVRAALGAGRGRLARQLGTESLLLSSGAAAVGVLVVFLLLPAVAAIVPEGLPRPESIRVDATVIGFTILLAVVTAVVAGLSPAMASARVAPADHLRSTRGATAPGTRRGRRTLVVVQVALAAVVVAAAGLLLRSVAALETVGRQAGADRLTLVRLSLPQGYEDRDRRLQFLTTAIQRLEATVWIEAATPINVAPFSGTSWSVPAFTADGQSRERAGENPSLDLEAVHANYFATFQLPIVRGRPFTAADTNETTPVAIVSEDVAARTWPGADPVGKRLKMGAADAADAPWMTIVGVAAATRYRELREARPTLYVPAGQLVVGADSFVLRTAAPPATVRAIVSAELQAIDSDVSVLRVAPFRELLDAPLARPRFNALLSAAFGAAALLLAAVGLYAVMAAYVRLHQRDIGVRVAVGASAADVRRLVVGEAARLAGIGAGIGLSIGAAANGLLRGLLFGVTPLDPLALAAAFLCIVGGAALASFLPARRAARIDPAIMLRAE